MATPTMKERRTMAGSGVAMPDGSFYIRDVGELSDAINAVGRATPNAGESETARRNSVRRHIMKRARALKRTDMIPDSWNPDGSLKHSAELAAQIDDFLAHHGVLGMKWGVHRRRSSSSGGTSGPGRPKDSGGVDVRIKTKSPALARPPRSSRADTRHAKKKAKYEAKAKAHEHNSVAYMQGAAHAKREHEDLMKNGLNSAAFKRVFGEHAITESEWAFYGKNGMSKAEALRTTANDLRRLHNQYVNQANASSKAAAHYRKKASELKHDDLFDGLDQDDLAIEREVFLAHYGVLGMKWGVRRNRGPGSGHVPSSVASPSNHPSLTAPRPHVSPEAARAVELHTLARRHGSHNLSNEELKSLVTRMNLEDQYGRLNHKQVSLGKKVAVGLLVGTGAVAAGVAKQTATTFAAKYAAKGVEELIKKAAAK